MKVKVKSYAKINLTLNVGEKKGGFHPIDSLVTAIDIYDEIAVSRRKDDEIRLIMRGIGETQIKQSENTAYKAALAFKEKFKTGGVNIEINKKIPLASGLGGSSADVAGVLRALKELYDLDESVKPIADEVGSDCGYMLTGGTARISGRGEIVEPLTDDLDICAVIVLAEDGVSTKECYEKFDSVGSATDAAATAKAVAAAESGDLPALFKSVSNDLAMPAATLNAEVGKNLAALKDLSPSACTVTGSGSAVFALYETPELCRWACDKLKKRGYNAIIVYTVPRYSMR